MAEIGESAQVSGKAGLRDHADNLAVFFILMVLLVTAGQNVGRLIGRRLNSAGLTAFFGG